MTRAGLTIGQTGQMPGALRLNIKTLLYWFFIFLGCWPRVKIVEFFEYCVWYIGQGNKLITLAFIVFEWLKRIEPNSTALYHPKIRSKSVHPWTSAEIFPGWGNVRIFLILHRLLTMPCKWTFTKRFTLSTTLVCAGWTSILDRCLKCFLHFGYQKCLCFLKLPQYPFPQALSTNKS